MEEKLREAVSVGNEHLAKEFIKSGVNINSQNSVNGWSALHWAAKRGYLSIAKVLIEAGANINIKSNDAKLPADLSSNLEMTKLLGGETMKEVDASKVTNVEFVPNYLRYPEFPYLNTQVPTGSTSSREANKEIISSPKRSLSHPNEMMKRFLFQPESTFLVNKTQWSPCGLPVNPDYLVLKVRSASASNNSDYFEISISRKSALSFIEFKELLCREFNLKQTSDIKLIRKLPDTLLRNDEDIRRLTDYQMLEIFFENDSL